MIAEDVHALENVGKVFLVGFGVMLLLIAVSILVA
jgi:hypothetical protein